MRKKGNFMRVSQTYWVLMVAVIMFVFLPRSARAQAVGATLSGTITDSSGAAIPNATLSIQNKATGIVSKTRTDAAGFYSAPNLLPGIYDVTISATGFNTVVETNIELFVSDQHVLNRSLPIGNVSEKVEVLDTTPAVELASSTLQSEVNSTTMRDLPLNGRDWTQLATLQPGVLPVRSQGVAASPTSPRANRGFGNQISDSGHRPYENNFRINGISVVDYANGSPGDVLGGVLGVDAIQEFSVLTSNYSAEYGRTSGGVVNAVTKSGTNDVHGDAYWFTRDKIMDARNYFDPAQIPPFHRQDFGASLGGPIWKNRTFLFLNYEGLRQDKSVSFRDFVPSPAARSGQLCSVPTGVTPNCTPTTATVSPAVLPYLGFYPLPNGGLIANGDTGVYNTTGLAQATDDFGTARLDHKISDKDNLASSWFWDKGLFSQPDPLRNTVTGNSVFREMFSTEETRVINSGLANTGRIGYSRVVVDSNYPVANLNPLAANTNLAAIPGLFAPILTVPGLTQMSGGEGAASQTNHVYNSFQAYDDMFMTRGVHSIKVGFAFERMQYNILNTARQNGSFSFPSLQGFLTNTPTTVQFLSPGLHLEEGSRQSLFGAYIQDDWRVLSRLTLNLGVRYEPTTLPTEANDRFQTITNFYAGGPVPVHTLWSHNQTLGNVAPRVGFSWDPFGDGKTAIRGGFGVYDVLPINWVYGNTATASSYPFANNVSVSKLPAGSFPDAALPYLGVVNIAKAQVRYVQQDPKASYSLNWNLNIQRQLPQHLVMTVGYVGSHSLHQPLTPNDMDMVLPTLTSAGYIWPYPVGSGSEFNTTIGSIRPTTWTGNSSYSGLQAKLQKQMQHGVFAQASYTFGKCMDYGSAAQVGDPFLNSLTSFNWLDPASIRGLCDFNIAQNFVGSFIWDLPHPGFHGVGRYVASGWELGGIFTAATGIPFTVVMAGDPLGMRGSAPNSRPDRLPNCHAINSSYRDNNLEYLNVNCFTPPTAPPSFAPICQSAAPSVAAVIPNTCMNLYGDSGRNALVGPGLVSFDFMAIKNMPIQRISETFNLQFRAELFNVLNHSNFQAPLDNLSIFNQNGTPVSGAGTIDSTTTDPRQIQLALKVIW